MLFVHDDDPAENKVVCDLLNTGLDRGLLLPRTDARQPDRSGQLIVTAMPSVITP